jgi:uncharacterized protein YjbJ (UPF0337 family)
VRASARSGPVAGQATPASTHPFPAEIRPTRIFFPTDPAPGTTFANVPPVSSTKEYAMGREDQFAGKAKQIKGKANDIAGAAKGKTSQQLKGKAQQMMGKAQEEMGKLSAKSKNQ